MMQVDPASWSNPTLEGNLLKKGHVRKNWKWRWFRLQGQFLFYFRTKTEDRPIGTLHLNNYIVKATPSKGRQYAFGLYSTQQPAYPLCALDEEDFLLWMKHLKLATKVSKNQPKSQLERSTPLPKMTRSLTDSREAITKARQQNVSNQRRPKLSRSYTDTVHHNLNASGNVPQVRRGLMKSRTESGRRNEDWAPTTIRERSSSTGDDSSRGQNDRRPAKLAKPNVSLTRGTGSESDEDDYDYDHRKREYSSDTESDSDKLDEATSFNLAMARGPEDMDENRKKNDESYRSGLPEVEIRKTPTGRVLSILPPRSSVKQIQSPKLLPRNPHTSSFDSSSYSNLSKSSSTPSSAFRRDSFSNGKVQQQPISIPLLKRPVETSSSSGDYDELDTIKSPNISPRGEEILKLADASPNHRRTSRSIYLMNSIMDEITLETDPLPTIPESKVLSSSKVSWRTVKRLSVSTAGATLRGGVHRELTPQELEILAEEEEKERLRKFKEKYVNKADPLLKYNIVNRSIGKGSVGEVFFATLGKDKKVAIKKLQLVRRGRDRLPLILREIEIIATSAHKNIVKYLESYEVGDELWVVMEYMSGGSLYDIVKLHGRGYRLREEETAYCIREILDALMFLHSRNRIHRDIKVDNILLGMNGAVKLADFGTAVQLTFQRLRRNTLAGTPYYMAPELIQRFPYKEKVDIWSIGITVVEILTGRPPFYERDPQEALELIVSDGVEGLGKEYSPEVQNFVNNCCLCIDPDDRSTAQELLQHPFLTKACTKEAFAKFLSGLNNTLYQIEESGLGSGCNIL